MKTAIITTEIVKDDDFKTVGIHMRAGNQAFHWGCSYIDGWHYEKVVEDKYFEEFVELQLIESELRAISNFPSRFFDIALEGLGAKALENKSFKFDEEKAREERLKARRQEIIDTLK